MTCLDDRKIDVDEMLKDEAFVEKLEKTFNFRIPITSYNVQCLMAILRSLGYKSVILSPQNYSFLLKTINYNEWQNKMWGMEIILKHECACTFPDIKAEITTEKLLLAKNYGRTS